MIKFEPIASSSEGNCYRVTDGKTSLLLEAGISFKDIQKALNFNVSDISGVLITHEHKDHTKGLQGILRAGKNVYMSHGTAKEIGISHHRIKKVEAHQKFKIGTWTIYPFETEHDVAEPLGYFIMNDQKEKLLFATDTYYIRYQFKGLNIIAIECNYSEKILEQNIVEGITPLVMRKRLRRSHFSLENVKEFFLENDLTKVQEIWLLHLSKSNSDSELFKKEIRAITGKPVYIA